MEHVQDFGLPLLAKRWIVKDRRRRGV